MTGDGTTSGDGTTTGDDRTSGDGLMTGELAMRGDWHLTAGSLRAYAMGQAGSVAAWSVELHLTSCPLCRAELALVLPEPTRAGLAVGRATLLATLTELPTQVRPRRHGLIRTTIQRRRLMIRPSALVAVLLAVGFAMTLAALDRVGDRGSMTTGYRESAGHLLWLLAPALPLWGVALCAVTSGDPCREVVLATPSGGLRLILWRTALVLAVAVPLAAGAGLALGGPSPALWLLPCLAMTTTALALGTAIGLERAATTVGLVWCGLALGPTVLARTSALGPNTLAVLRNTVLGGDLSAVLAGGPAQGCWAVLLLAAGLGLVWRRSTYERLAPTLRSM